MYVCTVRYVAYTVLEDKELEPQSSRMKRACCSRLTDYRIAQHTSFLPSYFVRDTVQCPAMPYKTYNATLL